MGSAVDITELLADLRVSAATAEYMELAGARKDADCEHVRVDGGVSSRLGCCDAYTPPPWSQEFRCGTCTHLIPTVVDLSELLYYPYQPRDPHGKFHPHEPRTIVWNGYTIHIENPVGSTRLGTNPDGSPWRQTMGWHYGYIDGVMGADGQPMDCFVGSDLTALDVFVARIIRAKSDQTFDEEKVVIGARSEEQAREVIISHYGDDPTFFESVTKIPVKDFAAWVGSSPHTRLSDRLVHAAQAWPASLCSNCGGRGCGPVLCRQDPPLIPTTGDQNPNALVDGSFPYLDQPTIVDNSRQRKTSTQYWHKPVHDSERHVNFAEIDKSMQGGASALKRSLKGKMRARVIRQVAKQAIEQKHAGRRATEFQFSHDHALQDVVRSELVKVYAGARKEAKAEVERQVNR